MNNIFPQADALRQLQYDVLGLGRSYVGVAGADVGLSTRLLLRPGAVVQLYSGNTVVIAGSDIYYKVGTRLKQAVVFLGAWYRSPGVAMVKCGVLVNKVRLYMNYDYGLSGHPLAGYEVAAALLLSGRPRRLGPIPCDRY